MFCISFFVAHAQKEYTLRKIDSLEQLLPTLADDTSKAEVLTNLANHYRQVDLQKSKDYALQTISLSKRIKDLTNLMRGYNNLGITFYSLSELDSAIAAFYNYGEACRQKGDSDALAWAYNNIGNVYTELGKYNFTLACYDTALQIRTALKDTVSIANSYINYGYVYKDLGKHTEALFYLYKALRTMESIGNKTGIAVACNFIGATYTRKNEWKKSNFYLTKAIEYCKQIHDYDGVGQAYISMAKNYKELKEKEKNRYYLLEALKLYSEINDQRQIAFVYSQLGELYKEDNKYAEAIAAYEKTIQIHEQSGSARSLPVNYANLAELELLTGKPDKALAHAQTALQIATESGSVEHQRQAARVLSQVFEKKGNATEALKYYKIYHQLNDTIQNTANIKVAEEIQTKYETEKKDLEIIAKKSELKTEVTKRRTQQFLWLGGVAILLLAFTFTYNRYRWKQKAKFDAELLKQQELRNKAIIEAEEKERIRIAKDLHDGVGQQISAVKMNLSALEHELKLEQTQKTKMEALLSLVDDAVKEVRGVSHNMMPNALIRSGLGTAVREFVNKLSATDALKINLQIVGLNERLESTTETVLYRVLQECVSNIIKHAHATEINIQLIKHAKNLNMMIEDNGKGFDVSIANSASGIGLKNMQSRVAFLNGTIEFDSTPNRGTTVVVDVPL